MTRGTDGKQRVVGDVRPYRFLPYGILAVIPIALLFLSCSEETPDNCGDGKPYNKHTQFCYAGAAYDKCADEEFDPSIYFCSVKDGADVLIELCGGSEYDPATEFCHAGSRHDKCGGETFDPGVQRCYEGKVVTGTAAFTLTVNAEPGIGGTVSRTPEALIYEDGTIVTVEAAPAEGFIFIGWSGNIVIDDNVPVIVIPMTRNLSLTANFRKWEEYAVIYDGNGGTGVPSPQVKTQDITQTLSLTEPTREGYEFVEWNTAADGSGKPYAPGADYDINDDLRLYAQWKRIEYIVAYDANGGTGAPAEQIKEHGVALTLRSPVPTRDGYSFTGWNLTSNGGGASYAPGESYTGNEAITLYAQWTEITYTVSYDANGGTGAPIPQTKEYDVTLSLSGSKPIRENYDFLEWNTAANGSGTAYAPGDDYTDNATRTLYAQWKLKTYTLTVNNTPAVGGTVSRSPDSSAGLPVGTYIAGTTITVTAKADSGFAFVNWTAASGTSLPTGVIATDNTIVFDINGDVNMTANFKVVGIPSLPITYDRRTYKTVRIGTQTWMAENLKYPRPRDGALCDLNDPYYEELGCLYDWATAMDIDSSYNTSSYIASSKHQGICPTGWHIPSDDEWETLFGAVGGGTMLKSDDGWNNGGNGTDEYGFSALPSGYIRLGQRIYPGAGGAWWSATEAEDNASQALSVVMYPDDTMTGFLIAPKGSWVALSVRCLRDD